jgi:hypothetical protein
MLKKTNTGEPKEEPHMLNESDLLGNKHNIKD